MIWRGAAATARITWMIWNLAPQSSGMYAMCELSPRLVLFNMLTGVSSHDVYTPQQDVDVILVYPAVYHNHECTSIKDAIKAHAHTF